MFYAAFLVNREKETLAQQDSSDAQTGTQGRSDEHISNASFCKSIREAKVTSVKIRCLKLCEGNPKHSVKNSETHIIIILKYSEHEGFGGGGGGFSSERWLYKNLLTYYYLSTI